MTPATETGETAPRTPLRHPRETASSSSHPLQRRRTLAWGWASALVVAALPAQGWQLLDMSAANDNGAAYDLRRQRAVFLSRSGDVWELEGSTWLRRPAGAGSSAPVPRRRCVLVYDAAREHVLLFGGTTDVAPLGDTWTWDGVSWRRLSTPISPPRRAGAVACYDPGRQRVVLFGGAGLQDTWEHDGATWTQLQPATVPGAQPLGGMAFDAGRGVAVLIQGDAQQRRVCEWNGMDWTLLPWTPALPVTVAYDPARSQLLAVSATGQVDAWNGTAATRVGVAPELARPASWFDPVSGRVLFAGTGTAVATEEIWAWDGARTARVAAAWRPSLRDTAVAELPGRGLVATGTLQGGTPSTWRWDGVRWTSLGPTGPQPARERMLLAADALAGRVVLFGGRDAGNNNTLFDDLWRFDGTTWTPVPAAARPPARLDGALAHDSVRNRLVLFGGQAASGTLLGDTWEHDGATWAQVAGAPLAGPSPSARRQMGMTFDPLRGVTVLLGGDIWGFPHSDTWEWDGTTWRENLAAGGVANRDGLVFDPARGAVILVSNRLDNLIVRKDTLEYRGAAWQLVDQSFTGTGLLFAPVYDSARGRLLAVGFYRDRPVHVHEWSTRGQIASVGAACGSAPALTTSTAPRFGVREFGLEAWTGPGSVALFAMSLAQSTTPLGGGCAIELGPVAATSFAVADARGRAFQPIPLPADPALRGVVVFAQAGVLGGGPGLSLTPGLAITVGD